MAETLRNDPRMCASREKERRGRVPERVEVEPRQTRSRQQGVVGASQQGARADRRADLGRENKTLVMPGRAGPEAVLVLDLPVPP